MSLPKKWLWHRDLLKILLNKELTVRYKGSVLGFLWSVLNPLAQAGVFYVVFTMYMRYNTPHYLIALLSAMFPWQWFANAVGEGSFTFLANPTLVKKVAFPRQAIPLVMNLQHMVHFCMALPVYTLFLLHDGLRPDWVWLWGLPMMLVLTLASIYGLCLFLGSVNLFFRDLGNLIIIILQMLFFATPIVYMLSTVPEQYHWYFKVNPVAPLFICWRSLLFENTVNVEYLWPAVGYACLFLAAGGLVFRCLQKRFAEVM